MLGSRSREVPLRAGEVLPAEPGTTRSLWIVPEAGPFALAAPGPIELRLLDGPDAGPPDWDGREFEVGPQSDRMGLRFEGQGWTGEATSLADRLSAPVVPGAVQVAGGGAIVLGVACGTMGGYPHVAQVASVDLDRLGQLRPGDRVRLRRVDRAEARRLDRARRAAIRAWLLRVGVAATG